MIEFIFHRHHKPKIELYEYILGNQKIILNLPQRGLLGA